MCRWFIYTGSKISIYDILYRPEHNILKQCYSPVYSPSYEQENPRDHHINIDGFGISIYDDSKVLTYKTTDHSWDDTNLLSLSKFLKSSLFMGHIRGIKPFQSTVPVHYNNCHPFTYLNYSFCHNGDVLHFNDIRETVKKQISNNLIGSLKGETDSEHLFFLMLSYLDIEKKYTGFEIYQVLLKSIKIIIELTGGKTSSFNICVTDGTNVVVTRFINSDTEEPPSLYVNVSSTATIIASEPLNKKTEEWKIIEKNHYYLIENKQASGKIMTSGEIVL